MNLEKITVDNLTLDFVNNDNIISLYRIKDYDDFYLEYEKFNKFFNILKKICTSRFISHEDIEIIVDFSDSYSYMISFKDDSCLEAIFKKSSLIYIKDYFGNYSTILKSGFPLEGKFLKTSYLNIRYFNEEGREIFDLLQNIYFVDLNCNFKTLYEIRELIPPEIRSNFLDILKEMITVCGFSDIYDDVSLEGFIKDKYSIPFRAESSGIKKLSWIYPWMWLSTTKKKKIIFYGGFLDDGLSPCIVRHLITVHKEIVALLCHS